MTSKDCLVVGGGDLNSRIGDAKVEISLPGYCYRENPDKVTNSHGKEMIKICKTFKVFFVNNLTKGDVQLDGDFTFQKGGRKSQNDILVANKNGLASIESFKIHNEINWNPSDHSPISVDLSINIIHRNFSSLASADILTTAGEPVITRAKRIHPEEVNWQTYDELTLANFNSLMQDLNKCIAETSLCSIDNMVENIDTCFSNAALVSNNVNRTSINVDFPEVNENLMTCAIIDTSVKSKQANMWREILSSADSKRLWNHIDWNGSCVSSLEDSPDIDDLVNHFQEKGQSSDDSTLLCEIRGNRFVPELDSYIIRDEVNDAINKLKYDKVTGDGWSKRMLTELNACFLLMFTSLLNIIFTSHQYPTLWRSTIISAIYKFKGLLTSACNYRPISLVKMLAKVFDFILVKRFNIWFTPHDSQTAYQSRRSCADHVFFLRCLIHHVKKTKEKLFLIGIDFDGAFDRVSRLILIKKLLLFGAGTIFVTCLASIYMSTKYTLFNSKLHRDYFLYAGIKQGLPLSPMLFLFYINDIFQFFDGLYNKTQLSFLERLSVLIHADDATLIATGRTCAISKLRSLLAYCNLNRIIPQYKKCWFITINGDSDDKASLVFGAKFIENKSNIELLGSHISQSGKLNDDISLHISKRYKSCIKFYNFLKSNKLAPLVVKLKVLKACVVSSLLHNCETFGGCPKEIEKLYFKMIKATLDVRPSTPNSIVLVETGLLPIKTIILARQWQFYKRFMDSLRDGTRNDMFNHLLLQPSSYMKYYVELNSKYSSKEEIYTIFKQQNEDEIKMKAIEGRYKFQIYMEVNPQLLPSPFINTSSTAVKFISRFRVGSHSLPIETGRWSRTPRDERVCRTCGVLGDERHFLYHCPVIDRTGLLLPPSLSEIWKTQDIFILIGKLVNAELL